jgi:DNA-binding MarR family transcriptional regulator
MIAVPEHEDPLAETELTVLLGLAFQLVLGEFVRRTDNAGYHELRPVHGMAFQVVGSSGATATELAERLGVTKQAAGQLVDDLERRGYLRRETHPGGGRRKLITLTPKADQHLATAGGILHGLEVELADTLGDQRLSELRVELARIVRAIAGDQLPPLRPVW